MSDESFDRPDLVLRAILGAFETDLRDFLYEYVFESIPAELESKLDSRREARTKRIGVESAGKDLLRQKLNGLFLSEAIDEINRCLDRLPADLAKDFDTVVNTETNRKVIFDNRNRDAHRDDEGLALAEITPILGSLKSRHWTNLTKQFDAWQRGELRDVLRKLLPERRVIENNLPRREHEYTKLVGRDQELQRVVSDLKSHYHPFVSIIAEGGLGKSALALEVGYQFLSSGEFELVLWHSAKTEKWTTSGARDIEGVETDLLTAIARLGKQIDPSFEGDIDQFLEVLGEIPTLLILDNFETFTGSSFENLVRKFPEKSRVKVLLTSRWGVGNFEDRIPLQPLSSKDSTHLLTQLSKEYNLNDVTRISKEAKASLVAEFGNGRPLDLVWFAKAKAAGITISELRTNKNELVSFCVGNVVDKVSPESRDLWLGLAYAHTAKMSIAEAFLMLGYSSVSDMTPLIQELTRLGLVQVQSSEHDVDLEYLVPNETAKDYLIKEASQEDLNFWRSKSQDLGSTNDFDYKKVTNPFNIYRRSPDDNAAALILANAIRVSRTNYTQALALLESASNLRKGYFEIDRVAGLIVSEHDFAESERRYLKAMELAENGTEKGRVAYAYAESLVSKMPDRYQDALSWSNMANEVFNEVATKLQLANIQVRIGNFSEAENLLLQASKDATGTTSVIISSSLLRLYDRWSRPTRVGNTDWQFVNEILLRGAQPFNVILTGRIIDRAAANALVKFATNLLISLPKLQRYLEPACFKSSLEELEPLIVGLLRNSEEIFTEANNPNVVLFEKNLGTSFWANLTSKPENFSYPNIEDVLVGRVDSIRKNQEKQFAFVTAATERFFFFPSMMSQVGTFESLENGDKVRFKVSDQPPRGSCRIACEVEVL